MAYTLNLANHSLHVKLHVSLANTEQISESSLEPTVESVCVILTIAPSAHVPGSSSGWVVSAAGLGWSVHVDISAARQGSHMLCH